MDGLSYTVDELAEVLADSFMISKKEIFSSPGISGANFALRRTDPLAKDWEAGRPSSYVFQVPTKAGLVWIRLIDWSVDEQGVPDSGNLNRGRVTQDWKIAPFFEHLKFNEENY